MLPIQGEAKDRPSQHSRQGGPQGPPNREAEANVSGPVPGIKFSGQGGCGTLRESPVSQSPQEDVSGSIIGLFQYGTPQTSIWWYSHFPCSGGLGARPLWSSQEVA